eukprot:Seg2656.3 transcript_id=Seg2656.3/GoldUCD/mRNA.D3Y31 product="Octopamine receptor" protein_id=Seg2656.3/GoldUCD/D3Y31
MESTSVIFKFVSLLTIDLVAFAGNILILITGLRTAELRKFNNAFIFNVALADLGQSVIIMPFSLASVYFRKWPLSATTCGIVGLFKVVFTLTSVQSLAGISLDRYYCVVKNRKGVNTKWRLVVTLAVVWSLSLILAISPIFGWGEIGFDDGKEICTILFFKTVSHTLTVVCAGLFIPVVIMAFCYYQIFRVLRSQGVKVRQFQIQGKMDSGDGTSFVETELVHKNVSSEITKSIGSSRNDVKVETCQAPFEQSTKKRVSFGNANPTGNGEIQFINHIEASNDRLKNNNSKGQNDARKAPGKSITFNMKPNKLTPRELRLLKTIFLAIMVFLSCWLPYAMFNVLGVLNIVEDNNTMDSINMWMGFANSALNPLIYGFTNRQFRQGIKKLFR